ncbi:MAG: helix-turn-helix transcriptional regulator [Clostridia bacterium]|nr:helix-turn-helix transcriptional regulator [Clostridia bacterium]
MSKYETWHEVKKELRISKEQEAEIKLEEELIEATIAARNKKQLTQRELSKRTSIPQSTIARIESGLVSPKIQTLNKLLIAMGYRLKIVEMDK